MHKLVPIAIGGFLLLLHAVFPPRMTPRTEQSNGVRVDRACILSRDYYWHLLAEDGTVLPPRRRSEAKSSIPLRMDWDLFITQSIAIVGLTIVGFAVAGIAQEKTKANKPQHPTA